MGDAFQIVQGQTSRLQRGLAAHARRETQQRHHKASKCGKAAKCGTTPRVVICDSECRTTMSAEKHHIA
jgi:hypothetical protein